MSESSKSDDLRKEILFQLYAVRPLTRGAEQIERECRKQGWHWTLNEIARELQFLADEALLICIDEPGTTARLYRIHAQGVRHYEQHYSP